MPSTINAQLPPLAPLAELRAWLARATARFRAARQFAPVCYFEVATTITADLAAQHQAISAAAHSAETHDREASAILGRVLADGRVSAEELPDLRRASRLVARSAALDHDIAERATLPPAA